MNAADPWAEQMLAEVDRLPVYRLNGHAQPRRGPDPTKICLTPVQWAEREIPPTDHLLGELFSTTSRGIFVADTGLGKTMFAVALAFAMNLGTGFLHWQGRRPARVLFVDGEMPRDLMKERLAMASSWFDADAPTTGLYFLSREDVEDMPPFDTEDGQQWLDAFIEALGGVDFIVFDNMMSLCGGNMKEEESWQPLKPYVLALTKRRIGQLWLHHVGHDKSRSYGTKTREWHMDTVMLGEAVEAHGADVAFRLTWSKARRRKPSNRADFEPVQIELRDGLWTSAGVTGSGGPKPRQLPPAAVIALDQLTKAIAEAGETMPTATNIPRNRKGFRADAWRERCYLAGISDGETGSARRKSFNRARERLCADGFIGSWEAWAWLA
jgi:hypothetical protein